MEIIRLTKAGEARVLDGKAGITFVVESTTPGGQGPVKHVIDFRYKRADHWLDGDRLPGCVGWQIWSLGFGGYESLPEPLRTFNINEGENWNGIT